MKIKLNSTNNHIYLFNKMSNNRWLFVILLTILSITTTIIVRADASTSIPSITLSTVPLYATTTVDKPVIALALSVEFPTVGAQYVDQPGSSSDATYSNTNEYLGYYDAEACYTYNDAPTETPATGLTSSDYKRFDRSGAATNRQCSNAFSGNFLNWASSSAIDMLRLALSGGDRYIDTASLTILQRAVIPDGDPTCMWNTSNFPAKQLKRSGGSNNYFGAIPTSMVNDAAGNDIWIANTLNRIYFRAGTSTAGTCGSTSGYTLSSNAARQMGPVTTSNTNRPNGGVKCADESSTNCQFTGTKAVWYGAGTTWAVAPAYNGATCSNGVFGDPIPGTFKECYISNYSGSWQPTTSGTSLNSDGFFYGRVQVCNKVPNSSTLQDVRDYGLCTAYPNGNFKPTGSIQKYSDQLRLAAFGYLLDQTDSSAGGRYGGVLRAPMKYVGAKTFDTVGQENTPTTGNANMEWDANTGVFSSNPDNDTTQTPNISGVINYLNKFGRTGSIQGRYKKYDPVGELHYETLRYLQGLQPTPAAVSNITSSMYDGFPVATTWTDPYAGRSNTADYSCLKSNIVVIGDVNTHDGSNLPAANTSNNIPDISYWTGITQSFENGSVTSYTDGQGAARTTGNPNSTVNGSPPGNQIIGQAYWAHTHDIRGTDWTNAVSSQRRGLRVKTMLFDVNEYGNSTSDNYRHYNNQFFTAAKYGGFQADSANTASKPYNIYGNPFKQQNGTNNNDVWQDATRPGEASSYYLQSSARGVLKAFDDIFNNATTKSNNIAATAAASTNITSAGSLQYKGSFDTSDWSGDVSAYPITVDSTNAVSVGSTATWSAATQLTAMSAPATNRKIYIGVPPPISGTTATEFTWTAIGATLKGNLNQLSPSSTSDGFGSSRLDFIRGDKTNQVSPSNTGGRFRSRSSLLGDIINSSIEYSGTPASSMAYASSTYSSFYSTYTSRTAAVFAGANDGMLHAFNATTGNELFAYIPSWMGPKLSALTSTSYNQNHQSYVDAPPAIAEAEVFSNGNAADWRTVLVAGTGAGGSGVFALDVTDPSNFDASKVMWEFTRADDPEIGFVVGKPQIARLRTSAAGATATYRWFAIVASGVNNYVPDSAGRYSTTGQPAIFLLALDKPAGTAWTATGTTPNYYKISLPVDSTLSTSNPTGVISFTAMKGSAGEVTQIYVGDLHGKLWKLDFSTYGAADWNINKLSAYNKGTTASPNPYPLFIAKTASSAVQPISTAPMVKAGPVVSQVATNYVAFTTGKYLENSDRTSTNQNSVYAVFDNGSTAADSNPAGDSVISGRGRLIAGTINQSAATVTVPAFNWGRAASDSDATQRSGWYADFASSGERSVSNGLVNGNNILFSTLVPAGVGTAGSCAASGGSGYLYVINLLSGTGTITTSTVGIPGTPFLVSGEYSSTISSISYPVPSDSTGRRIKQSTKTVLQSGTTGSSTGVTTTTSTVSGRLSWRQINNYITLKNAP